MTTLAENALLVWENSKLIFVSSSTSTIKIPLTPLEPECSQVLTPCNYFLPCVRQSGLCSDITEMVPSEGYWFLF